MSDDLIIKKKISRYFCLLFDYFNYAKLKSPYKFSIWIEQKGIFGIIKGKMNKKVDTTNGSNYEIILFLSIKLQLKSKSFKYW